MALKYICNYCETEYDAENDRGTITYMDGNKRNMVSSGKDPCEKCNEAAEKAKKEALEARKKKNEQ